MGWGVFRNFWTSSRLFLKKPSIEVEGKPIAIICFVMYDKSKSNPSKQNLFLSWDTHVFILFAVFVFVVASVKDFVTYSFVSFHNFSIASFSSFHARIWDRVFCSTGMNLGNVIAFFPLSIFYYFRCVKW